MTQSWPPESPRAPRDPDGMPPSQPTPEPPAGPVSPWQRPDPAAQAGGTPTTGGGVHPVQGGQRQQWGAPVHDPYAVPPEQPPYPQASPQAWAAPQGPAYGAPTGQPRPAPTGQPYPAPGQAYPASHATSGHAPAAVPTARPQLAVVTWSIIAICCAVWLAELLVPGFFEQVALSPYLGEHQPWRFITSAFAHSTNVTHLGFNMFALWSVGRLLEMALGRARYLALYLLSALGGGVGFVLLAAPPTAGDPLGRDWFTAVVGASGAVFGLFGALIPLYRRVGASLRSIWLVLLVNAAIAFGVPNIAWQSHLGGFLVGLVAAQAMMARTRRPDGGDRTWLWLGLEAALLVLLLVGRYVIA